VRHSLVTANVVPISPIFVTLIMEFLQEPHGVTSQKTPFFKQSMFLGSRAWLLREADNLTAIYALII
jgi:hypothetical protein